jgi:hypothetical protein
VETELEKHFVLVKSEQLFWLRNNKASFDATEILGEFRIVVDAHPTTTLEARHAQGLFLASLKL